MSKKNANSSGQLALELLRTGRLDGLLDEAMAVLSSHVRRACPDSRAQLCSKLAALLGREISPAQFNAWTAKTNHLRIPIDAFIALLFLLDAWEVLDRLLAPLGRKTSGRKDQAYEELGRVQLEKENLAAREQRARRQLQGGN